MPRSTDEKEDITCVRRRLRGQHGTATGFSLLLATIIYGLRIYQSKGHDCMNVRDTFAAALGNTRRNDIQNCTAALSVCGTSHVMVAHVYQGQVYLVEMDSLRRVHMIPFHSTIKAIISHEI